MQQLGMQVPELVYADRMSGKCLYGLPSVRERTRTYTVGLDSTYMRL